MAVVADRAVAAVAQAVLEECVWVAEAVDTAGSTEAAAERDTRSICLFRLGTFLIT